MCVPVSEGVPITETILSEEQQADPGMTDQYAFSRGMRLLWKSSSESLGKCLVYRPFRKGYMLDLK